MKFIPAGPVDLYSGGFEYQPVPYSYWKKQFYLPVFRLESFGNTQIRLYASRPGEVLTVVLEGPFVSAETADFEAPGAKFFAARSMEFEGTLASPGIYKVYLLPQELWAGETPRLPTRGHRLAGIATTCSAYCHRPTMDWYQFAEYLQGKKVWAAGKALVPQLLASRLKLKPEEANLVRTRLQALAEDVERSLDTGERRRFPIFGPPAKMGKLQEILQAMEFSHPQAPEQTEGDLLEILASGSADRERKPAAIHPSLPEVSYGHYIDNCLSDKELKESRALAHLMTGLSVNDKGPVIHAREELNPQKRVDFKSPNEVMEFLLSTGHVVITSDQRTYANFFALKVGDNTDTVFPPWYRTGLFFKTGPELVVPMGHSQHTWQVWGPLVSARFGFYLGITGAGFFPSIDSRPLWTGPWRSTRVESNLVEGQKTVEGNRYTQRAIRASQLYFQRNQVERDKLLEDGYGLLGVCNDANAVVAFFAAGLNALLPYPLLRAAEALIPVKVEDELSPLIVRIPRDISLDLSGGMDSEIGRSVLERIVGMSPHPLDSAWYPDATLRRQMRAASAVLKEPRRAP